MAIIKCKMCGGDLVLVEGQSVAECEYCGSRQTVPVADNEKKLTLFARANRLRAACEFDKAAGIYESIVADFPEEAESYWGLVLCKYGIEYVDDPATGNKIPTCHRSSFDSVMDDSNFEQAMENADEVALRVYRQEAKQIEEIRKGILEVSSSEKPYDIFICYKETDSNGDRTVDSLLAQDIYDALTSKGYRVFFSRITLEDKLGQAYEPYIFAALNSAKIMLAVGTCYENYNAVWVKNEWSRYLKIIAQDKNKYLIPCYKNIDAYDIPKEFAHLQGQDMGKVGAITDLLRGIEKLIPRQKDNTVVVQEKVVVGSTGGSNKIASLLDRGNMALEDGDWAKADSFFEDVLNNDSRNAQAYIGKTLAQEKCQTMDALIRKRRDMYQNVAKENLYICEKTAHINEMAIQCSLTDYVEKHTIQKLYKFDLCYTSEVSGRQKQYHEEEIWWQNHKLLSRAEKFAEGEVAEYLQNEKKHLFTQLADRVKQAQEAESQSIAKLEAAYDAHIAEADKRAEKLYKDGLSRQDREYQSWLMTIKSDPGIRTLDEAWTFFANHIGYKDSENLAKHCRKRIADLTAEQERREARRRAEEAERRAAEEAEAERQRILAKEEAERQRLIAEQKRKAQQKRNKTIGMIAVACVMLVIAITFVVTQIVIPGNHYEAAAALAENGHYEEAIAAFEALGNYKDSVQRVESCKQAILEEQYLAAVALMKEGKYEEALTAIQALSGYKDSDEMRNDIEELQKKAAYDKAVILEENGENAMAAIAFGKMGDYQDARERSLKLWDTVAVRDSVSTGYYHTVGLEEDGTVVAVGSEKYGRCDVSGWADIVAVSAGEDHTVGLKADGTVVAVGSNYYGECDVSEWRDIVAISARNNRTAGLKADGNVFLMGQYAPTIVDGEDNLLPYGVYDSDWTGIVAISTGRDFTLGLKVDGTVVAEGDSDEGECDVSDWEDIVAISAGSSHSVGLKADGTVVAVGWNLSGQCDVAQWSDIVAISAGTNHTVGLKADGTVVAVGCDDDGQCDVSDWKDIVAIYAGHCRTVGLKADGTVIAVGQNAYNVQNDYNACEVSHWKNIKLS